MNGTRSSTRLKIQRNNAASPATATNNKENNNAQKSTKKTTTGQRKSKKPTVKTLDDLDTMKEELQQLEDPPSTPFEKEISSSRLPYSFYDAPCVTLAKNVLGKILVRKLDDGTILKGRIVETESYLGIQDKASATYQGRVTSTNIPMYMPSGTIFVYRTYGMYHCFNISSQDQGSSIFIRAVEPLINIERMKEHRNAKLSSKTTKKEFKIHELCSGPSKMCIAFDITKEHTKYSMCSWKGMWIEEDPQPIEKFKIVETSRIGIDSAGVEWASKPLRFYILGNESVSKIDKKAELKLLKEN